MLRLVFILALLYPVYSKDETLSDLQTLFDDPELFRELEKRLGILPGDGEDSQAETERKELSCFALTGTLNDDCEFHATNGSIIQTRESMDRGAEFLQDYSNFSCAKDCTAECCANPDCDTTVYQDKDEHNCYLFKCGEPSQCVFARHYDYWTSSVSQKVHKSHTHTGTGATSTHENELHGLQGSHDNEPVDEPNSPSTTTVRTTTVGKPGKHCRNTEFECDNDQYGPDVTRCVHSSYVCDGKRDCPDNSDEYGCPDKNADFKVLTTTTSTETSRTHLIQNVNPNLSRPHYGHKTDDNPRGPNRGKLQPGKPNIAVHPSHPHTEPPTTETSPTITTSRPDTHKSSDTDTDTDTGSSESTESQTSDNTADTETQDTEPDSKDTETQSTEGSSTNSNKTETGSVAKENQSGSKENVSEKGKGFELYESDKVEVVSYTDNTQGPIIALALGLAITMIMLIFVGCRLRTVKRRLRKGRALHSNEADYLINGMYL